METRKILIINSSTQSQNVINESRATTLGELKAEMDELGIPYAGMTFYEGHMRAELKDDASPLPTNIPFKGEVINDLTFMLTVPDKKVASGATKRKEIFDKIVKLGLQDECKRRFGSDYTHCTSASLVSLIEEVEDAKDTKEEVAPVDYSKPADEDSSCGCEKGSIEKAFILLVETLYEESCICSTDKNEILSILKGNKVESSGKMSKKEIDEMFSFLRK